MKNNIGFVSVQAQSVSTVLKTDKRQQRLKMNLPALNLKPPQLLSGCPTLWWLLGLDAEQWAPCVCDWQPAGLCRDRLSCLDLCDFGSTSVAPALCCLVLNQRDRAELCVAELVCVCVCVTLRTAAMTNTDWCDISGSSVPLSSLSRSSRQALAPAERLKTPLVYGPSRYRNTNMSWRKQEDEIFSNDLFINNGIESGQNN